MYKATNYEDRLVQYANYLRNRQFKRKLSDKKTLKQLSDQEIILCYQKCPCCDDVLYSDNDIKQAIMEFESPKKTFDALLNIQELNSLKHYAQTQEWEPLSFGKSTWEFTEIKDVSITREIRKKIVSRFIEIFAKWVENGETFNLVHDEDPEYDHSGELQAIPTDRFVRLSAFENLDEWSQNCYTGDKIATHESGCGWYYPKYECYIRDLITESLYDCWIEGKTEEKFNEITDKFSNCKKDRKLLVKYILRLEKMVGKLSTCEAYLSYI